MTAHFMYSGAGWALNPAHLMHFGAGSAQAGNLKWPVGGLWTPRTLGRVVLEPCWHGAVGMVVFVQRSWYSAIGMVRLVRRSLYGARV